MTGRKNNRFFLLQLRKRKELVDQGITVLTSKRDALMKEFHGVVKEVAIARQLLDRRLGVAAQALLTAEGVEERREIESAADASVRDLPIAITRRNVWGVKVPEIDPPDARRTLLGRGSAPLYRSPAVDETAGRFELAINAMLSSATLETRLARIGGELKKTSRRLNALEQKIAPAIANDIKGVEAFLEEQARDEVFRLKRFKKKQEQAR